MKVNILTTQTTHHRYFLDRLASKGFELFVVCEASPVPEVGSFTHDCERHEINYWYQNAPPNPILEEFRGIQVSDINEATVLEALKDNPADCTIIFGTKKVCPQLICQVGPTFFNLHGGDICRYRGLDSHLWAISNNDFSSIVTCLHRVVTKLDAGEVFESKLVPLNGLNELFELRARNTEICVELVVRLLDEIKAGKKIFTTQPERLGQYYSKFPKEMLRDCFSKFKRHCSERGK